MQMRIGCTSVGLKIPLVPKDFSLGVSGANGVWFEIKQGFVVNQFKMNSSISVSNNGVLGGVAFRTEWFEVRDPDKGVLIRNFDKKLAEVDITPLYCRPRVDVSLKIYDEYDQPWYYTMEKVNVLMKGFITAKFHLREKMILTAVKGWHKDEDSCLAMR